MVKPYLLSICAAILLLLGIFYYYSFSPKLEINPGEAVLIIDFGENNKRAFSGEVIEGMTVFDALLVSARAGNVSFDFKNNSLKRIDWLFQENGKKWNVYFNRKKVEEDLNDILIKPGDKIELKLEER